MKKKLQGDELRINVSPSENLKLDAVVTSWQPLTLNISIWHPQLAWLGKLMDNKLMRNELDAYESNAEDYLKLVDHLVRQAIMGEAYRLQQEQSIICKIIKLAFITSISLYFVSSAAGIFFVVISSLLLGIECYRRELKKKALYKIIDAHARTFEQRRQKFSSTVLTLGGMQHV